LKWIEDVKVKFEVSNHGLSSIPILILGNKYDVITPENEEMIRQVLEERIKKEMNQIYVQPFDRNKKIKMDVIGYEFTSARNDINIKEPVDRILNYICENQLDNFPKMIGMNGGITLQNPNRNNNNNGKKCC